MQPKIVHRYPEEPNDISNMYPALPLSAKKLYKSRKDKHLRETFTSQPVHHEAFSKSPERESRNLPSSMNNRSRTVDIKRMKEDRSERRAHGRRSVRYVAPEGESIEAPKKRQLEQCFS